MRYRTFTMENALSEIIDYRGKTPKKSDGGVPTLSAKSVKNGYIDYSNCYYISEEEYERFMVRGFPKIGDILFTTEAPMGLAARLDREDVAIAQRLLTLRGKDNILDNDYLLYWLQSDIGQAALKARETGTTVTGIKQSEFRKVEISLPSIIEQKKISLILRALDDKIALNIKINENLEQQIDALFADVFIQNADPTWKVGTISDLGDVVGGSTPSKKIDAYYTDNGIAWITPKDLSQDHSKFFSHGEIDITELGLSKSSAVMMPAGTVLFSSRAPIGYIAIASNELCTNQGFKSVVPKAEVGTAFVYCFLKANLPTIESMASGSTFKEISGSTMKSISATIPDSETISRFNDFAEPLLLEQQNFEAENRRLVQIRDSLLPRLMSGELDVSNLNL